MEGRSRQLLVYQDHLEPLQGRQETPVALHGQEERVHGGREPSLEALLPEQWVSMPCNPEEAQEDPLAKVLMGCRREPTLPRNHVVCPGGVGVHWWQELSVRLIAYLRQAWDPMRPSN